MRPLLLPAIVVAVFAGIAHAQAGAQRAEFLRQAAALYTEPPDVSICKAGQLNDAQRLQITDTLNSIRALHGLAPVTYDKAGEDEAMSAALLMAANGKLSHTPTADWKCWSVLGTQGAGHSNLTGGVISPYLDFDTPSEDVVNWLTDVRNAGTIKAGHRLWILSPFLTTVAYGKVSAAYGADAVTDGAALKITDGSPIMINPHAAPVSPNDPLQIIAYPWHDYPASDYAPGALLSFSLFDPAVEPYQNSTLTYDGAVVTVTARDSGNVVAVSDVEAGHTLIGPMNSLTFAAVLQPHVVYDVTISDVKTGPGSQGQTYRYWFRIVD